MGYNKEIGTHLANLIIEMVRLDEAPPRTHTVAITGNTFHVKEKLKEIGARWDPDRKAWMVEPHNAEKARQIVSGAPKPTESSTPGKCIKCHDPVKEPYKVCYKCKMGAEGKCLNCGEHLNTWERQHGVKRCSNCRDGGGNAHGGQSYHDRHGNFVLGDDD